MDKGFVEHAGALFKPKPEGGYLPAVYCPHCKDPVSALADSLYFYCPRCNWRAKFKGQQLHAVMESLPDANGDD